MHTDPVDLVRLGYDALGKRYRSWTVASVTRLGFLRQLLDRLPTGSRVVDLGCGPGDPSARLLSAQHRVLGVDLSRVQIELARQAAPSAEFVIADLTHFSLRPGSVDAVICIYVLGHVPAKDHRSILREIAKWLRPGGLLLANAPLGAGASIAADWLGVQMFFDGLGEEETIAAIAEAGLELEAAERVADEEDRGEFVWLTATQRRSAGPA